MLSILFVFVFAAQAVTPERLALCRLAEAVPCLLHRGWRNCAQITDNDSLSEFEGLALSRGQKNVTDLYITGKTCSGTLPDIFAAFTSLNSLGLDDTALVGTLPVSIRAVRQTLTIELNSGIGGTLPPLADTLQTLILRETALTGTLPGLATSMRRLQLLTLHKIAIEWTLPDSTALPELYQINVRDSPFGGTLPASLPPRLQHLEITRSKLIGTIPDEYFRKSILNTLLLDGNALTGTIPAFLSQLSNLVLSNNRLTGTIPSQVLLGRLFGVNLSGNQLTGTIPDAVFTVSNRVLMALNLARNALTGTLPVALAGPVFLSSLSLSENKLSGEIPAKLFSSMPALRKLELDNNNFNGTLQGTVGARNFYLFSLANNSLSGSLPTSLFISSTFQTLDLSGNHFTECGPLEPIVLTKCDFGGYYFGGCTPRYGNCSATIRNDCRSGSGFYGATCKRCNCVTGFVCKDGVDGDGTCEGFNPCKGNNCEGNCNINGNSYVCSCPFPAIINTTDQRSCDCPFGFTKNVVGGGCTPCAKIDNCLALASCIRCSVCAPGYAVTLEGTCLLNKDCLFSDWTAWSKCDSCSDGVALRYRNLSERNTALPFYCQEFLYNRTSCGYPCVETTITSKDAILDYLYRSTTQWNWLAVTVNHTELSIEKTADELLIAPPIELSFLQSMVAEILPLVNDSRFVFKSDGNRTSVGVLAEETPNTTAIVVGAVVAVVVGAVVAVALLIRRRRKRWLFDLPEELQQHFQHKGSGWTTEGNCEMRVIDANDASFREIWDRLSVSDIPIGKVHALCNPMLGASFSNYRSILRQRMTENAILFCKQDWRLRDGNSGLRSYTHERYLQLAEYFSWNDPEETVPIIACLHATDFATAKSIASKGFCALATLDEGFYGKGIYFSTYGSYVAPYCIGKAQPAILVNLVVGGNAFPIIEAATDRSGFLGKPTVSGYQSHFVLTKSDGTPITREHTQDEFNEIVLGQEAQVVPIYLVSVATDRHSGQFTRSSSSLLTPLLVEESEMP